MLEKVKTVGLYLLLTVIIVACSWVISRYETYGSGGIFDH